MVAVRALLRALLKFSVTLAMPHGERGSYPALLSYDTPISVTFLLNSYIRNKGTRALVIIFRAVKCLPNTQLTQLRCLCLVQ
jgi:hypothetical protein